MTTATMKALTHASFGNPRDVIELTEVAKPEPGEGEVRVKIVLATIHNHDLATIRGVYGYVPPLPAIGGSEAYGIVDALGDGVTDIEIGQRVNLSGLHDLYAEYGIVQASRATRVPDAVSDESAAQLFAMPFSAITLLDSLGVKEGDWVVQNAANGAVGRMFAQLAATRGVNVVGIVRRAEAVEAMKAQGIDRIVSTDNPDWKDEATAFTDGNGFAAAVDSVGGPASADMLNLLATYGTLVIFGALNSAKVELPVGDVLFKQVTVRGFWGSAISKSMPREKVGALAKEVVARIVDGSVTLPVDGVYDATDYKSAFEASETPGRGGKVLIRF